MPRVLATTTIIDGQPHKGLVVEYNDRGIVQNLIDLSTCQTETAHTVYHPGTIEIREGAIIQW